MRMTNENAKAAAYVVSDSLGETGELIVRAVLSQFDQPQVKLRRFPYVERFDEIDRIITEAEQDHALIIFTLVVPELRAYMIAQATERQLPYHDILGPALQHFEHHLGALSGHRPGLLHRLDEQYFKKMEAVEFAVKYDDGRDAKGLRDAELVLIGVSRTSKTPLSMYLATKAYKVVNVPLVPEIQPMRELFQIDARKIVGLRVDPLILQRIREARLKNLGLDEHAAYATIERIKYELDYADNIMRKLNCLSIDVSNRAVEETAGRILQLLS